MKIIKQPAIIDNDNNFLIIFAIIITIITTVEY